MKSIEKLSARVDFNELLDNLDPVSLLPPEEDLPPEFCTYQDEGCEIAPSCLECPLPQCTLDLPRGLTSENKALRDEAICSIYRLEKIPAALLAKKFYISKRTVERALRKIKSPEGIEPKPSH
jgi:hypothetical protein